MTKYIKKQLILKMKKPKLSIIILNYNTADLLADCLNSLKKVKNELNFEVIVVDNGSIDNSIEVVKSKYKWVNLIKSKTNLGFAAGNNLAKNKCKGDYVLFLNSDTIVYPKTLKKTVKYLEKHNDVGALGCRTELSTGKLDKDCRRSFPTPWVSFTHFSHIDKIFPKSPVFSKYWYSYVPDNKTIEVEALQGAFLLSPKKVLDKAGWFDEDYFLDGEDIDLCWKIHSLGLKNIYYADAKILHLKGATKGKNKKMNKNASKKERLKYVTAGVNSMQIFYTKRLKDKYPFYIDLMVLMGIRLIKYTRIARLYLQ